MAGYSIYNFGIPNIILNSVSRAYRFVPRVHLAMRIFVLLLSCVLAANAGDWSAPEQQLARKIAAVTGTGTVSLSFENRSSLGRRDSEIIQNGIRSMLESMGIRFAPSTDAGTSIVISLSENQSSYVWVAQINPGQGDPSVVIVSTPRPENSQAAHDSVPLSVRKIFVWQQSDPILDLAVLEENAGPSRIAVLSPERLSLFRMQSGKWQQEQALEITHANPWPRDLRGRLVPGSDHLLDVYLPGVFCQTGGAAPLSMTCREGGDFWPLAVRPATPAIAVRGAFSPRRNFFTGVVSPAITGASTLAAFYSAAPMPRDSSLIWVLSGVDRQTHVADGANDRVIRTNWGSDLAAVRTGCGAGSQVLATSSADGTPDSVRAYEFPDRDPVPVSPAVDFPGIISAFWTEAKGDTVIAVTRNQESGNYEAFRLAVACSQ